jgi:hypothetical protein
VSRRDHGLVGRVSDGRHWVQWVRNHSRTYRPMRSANPSSRVAATGNRKCHWPVTTNAMRGTSRFDRLPLIGTFAAKLPTCDYAASAATRRARRRDPRWPRSGLGVT